MGIGIFLANWGVLFPVSACFDPNEWRVVFNFSAAYWFLHAEFDIFSHVPSGEISATRKRTALLRCGSP
jgi:hypothetical protein